MWFRRRRAPRIHDELTFHRDQLIDRYLAAGMDRREAERRALLEFGGVAQIEEQCRDVRGHWLEDAWRDVHYAIRTLRRNPGFAAAAVLSLALGIGANTAIFTLINTVLLRALPVSESDRLVHLARLFDNRPMQLSLPLFERVRDEVASLSGVFAQAPGDVTVTMDGEDEFVAADLVSGAYFTVLRLEPAVGRLLTPADDVLSPAGPAAVISDRFWERRFGRDPSAIGRTLAVRDRTFTIVGVTPRTFSSAAFDRSPDLFLPLLPMTTDLQRREGDLNWVLVLGRLKAGATVDQANAELQVLYRSFVQSLAEAAPEKDRPAILRQGAAALAAPDGFNPLRDIYRGSLLILMGTVTLVLLLACVNLSGLLLARAAARRREISIRLAVGAGRGRVIRQLLAESLVLAAIGGLLGLVVGFWFSGRLFALFANGREVTLPPAPDVRVLAFTAVIALAACGLSSLAPAFQALRVNLNPTLKEVRASRHGTLGKMLVVTQLAISMVLVVGATLFLGTLIRLNAVDRGFDSDGTLVVTLRTRRPYPPSRVRAVQRALLDRLRMLPGVRSASASQMLPLAGGLWERRIHVDGYTFRPDESDVVALNAVAPGYFVTLGTPLASGREFDERDSETSRRVAIVNESFARRFFAGRSALGGRVTSVNVTYEIVGVVRDARYQNLRSAVIDTFYIPWTQREDDQPTRYNYLARVAAGDPMQLVPGLERAVREADPALRVRATQTYASVIDQSITTERLMAALGGLFGVLALLLAALGMFGLLAFRVAQRTGEIGVRMALGATRVMMMRSVLADVAVVTGAGISIGCVAALLLAGLARSFLFELTPTDPAVFLVAGATLATAAVVAGWLPARRASRVDPLVALRHE